LSKSESDSDSEKKYEEEGDIEEDAGWEWRNSGHWWDEIESLAEEDWLRQVFWFLSYFLYLYTYISSLINRHFFYYRRLGFQVCIRRLEFVLYSWD
jgi:hypothetical protein